MRKTVDDNLKEMKRDSMFSHLFPSPHFLAEQRERRPRRGDQAKGEKRGVVLETRRSTPGFAWKEMRK